MKYQILQDVQKTNQLINFQVVKGQSWKAKCAPFPEIKNLAVRG